MYIVHLYVRRNPDVTPQAFRDHYENVHMPLLQEILGRTFPKRHIRRYLARGPEAPHEAQTLPVPGTDAAATAQFFEQFDAVTEVGWDDQQQLGETMATMTDPENRAKISADEEKFLDQAGTKMVVIGEVCEST
jgi:hypothetical protein